MRRSLAAIVSAGWGMALGGTFGGVLPWLSGDWHIHHPLPDWWLAQTAAGLLICAGLVPIVLSFVRFVQAKGTPVPVAAPPHLVVTGPYRYVRNPIYASFLAILLGEALFFGSLGLLEYAAAAMVVGLGAVHLYEEPALARTFGSDYDAYRHAVRAWLPRLHPWHGDPARSTEETPRAGPRPTTSGDKRRCQMARIEPAGRAAAGLSTRIALYFTRRAIARLTGKTTERMVEPLEVYARVPRLFKGYAKLEQATGKLHRLPKRLHALAELKAAALTHCEYCIDMGSAIARHWGLRDEELLALSHYRTSPLFSELDRLVLDYAVGMSRTPVEVSDDLFDELRQHLDDEQILELTHHVALENLRGRFNLALGIGSAGFSEGMVCALPDDAGSS